MTPIEIAIAVFAFLEVLNIIILYFFPTSKKGNGVGVFNAYEQSKQIPEVHALVKYLINWVAGTKLIFIVLLLIILWLGDAEIKWFAGVALLVSILSFYWRLFPLIRKMDRNQELNTLGYSKTLGFMILFILVGLLTALIWSF